MPRIERGREREGGRGEQERNTRGEREGGYLAMGMRYRAPFGVMHNSALTCTRAVCKRKRIFCREWTVRPSVRPSTSKRQSSQLSTESWQWTEGRKTVPRLPLSRDSFMSPIHLSHIFSRAPAATHVNTDFGARVNQCRNIRLRLVRISFMDEIETIDGRVRSGAGEGGALETQCRLN